MNGTHTNAPQAGHVIQTPENVLWPTQVRASAVTIPARFNVKVQVQVHLRINGDATLLAISVNHAILRIQHQDAAKTEELNARTA
jgi:hypothetical protein